jgi:hypothetical protein
MSCLTQHKTKEELSDWLMNNASDNETTGFLDMLAGDIWDMMNAESENKELKEEKVKWESLWFNQNEWCNELTEKVDKLTDENYELKEANKKCPHRYRVEINPSDGETEGRWSLNIVKQ